MSDPSTGTRMGPPLPNTSGRHSGPINTNGPVRDRSNASATLPSTCPKRLRPVVAMHNSTPGSSSRVARRRSAGRHRRDVQRDGRFEDSGLGCLAADAVRDRRDERGHDHRDQGEIGIEGPSDGLRGFQRASRRRGSVERHHDRGGGRQRGDLWLSVVAAGRRSHAQLRSWSGGLAGPPPSPALGQPPVFRPRDPVM